MLVIKLNDAYYLVFSDVFTSSVKRIKKKYKKLYGSIEHKASEIVNDLIDTRI
jgi:hypothetical protein